MPPTDPPAVLYPDREAINERLKPFGARLLESGVVFIIGELDVARVVAIADAIAPPKVGRLFPTRTSPAFQVSEDEL